MLQRIQRAANFVWRKDDGCKSWRFLFAARSHAISFSY